MGISGFDLSEPVFGIPEMLPPVDNAYTQWNTHPAPLPPTANTPSPTDNGAHDGIQGIPELQAQIRDFLKADGTVTRVCNGPCDYP